jgi:hypothetical protein
MYIYTRAVSGSYEAGLTRTYVEARRLAEPMNACVRILHDLPQLKPALCSIAKLLRRLGGDAMLSPEARNCAELAQLELIRFDALVRHMAHLAGVA